MGRTWELDVTAGAADAPIGLYLRDSFLDTGWLSQSQADVPNPLNPSDQVHHYQCADIKIDAQQSSAQPGGGFYQTDPKGAPPLSHVLFDKLKDNSYQLPGTDGAMVHVQVHNRGLATASDVLVWALFCKAAAGVPALSASPSTRDNFRFWDMFPASGQVLPQLLPADSPWQPIGPPQSLPPGIDPAHPKVASWQWTVPTLPSGDPGHYCLVAFVHSADSPIQESSFDVDGFVASNRQVGQKNVHVGPALAPGPDNGSPEGVAAAGSSGTGMSAARTAPSMREYVEFHNPAGVPRSASFVLDLRTLPPEIRVSFALTPLTTAGPLASAITGIYIPGADNRQGLAAELVRWLDRIEDDWEHSAGELLEWAGPLLENPGRNLEDLPPHLRRLGHRPRVEPTIYTALPSARVEINGVRLAPYGKAAAVLSLKNTGNLPPDSRYTFHVQQLVGGQVAGGSAYTLRIAGERQRLRFPEPDVH
jgi:hypothetical protein